MKDTETIKEKIDIVSFISEYVPLKKTGRNFIARCPFHAEKTPSFVVSADRQIWRCFGACNEGGDIFTFLMKIEHIEFPEALKELGKRAGITINQSFTADPKWQVKERLFEINHLASEYYHYLLTSHAVGIHAREYLAARGLHERLIKHFMIGYAPAGWNNVTTFLQKKGYSTEEIIQSGLTISGNARPYDRFRGRVMFTLHNHRGDIVGFSGRVLTETERVAKYINTPETLLYHKGKLLYGLNVTREAIGKSGYVLICEGEFDVLSAYQHGITNVVAIKGTALTEDQLRLLKRYTSEIRLCLDMDLAGDVASRRSIELAEQLEFAIRVVQLPTGKDLDEALKTDQFATKKAIEHAVAIYDFILDSALGRHDATEPFSKKRVADEVLPYFERISNPILHNHYVKKLAVAIRVSESSIEEALTRSAKMRVIRSSGATLPEPVQTRTPRQTLLEEYLLSLIIQSTKPLLYLQIVAQTLTIEVIRSNAVRKLFSIINEKQLVDMKSVDQFLPQELVDIFNKAYLRNIESVTRDASTFEKELKQVLVALKRLELRRKLGEVATKLKQEEAIETLNTQFRSISEQLKTLH
ncbi:DNA primase [Candidatus Roizmanbacteria bacterium]|nr:DNA primase [Candidatus Roizmanbacteria bacterium]